MDVIELLYNNESEPIVKAGVFWLKVTNKPVKILLTKLSFAV